MDYCVQCWTRYAQRVAASKTVDDDPLCDIHAKEAGWKEPADSPLKNDETKCLCGKPKRHRGRCTGYSPWKPQEIARVDATVHPLPTPAESILAAPNAPPYVTLTVTEAALDNFWMKLPVAEKAKIVEGMLR